MYFFFCEINSSVFILQLLIRISAKRLQLYNKHIFILQCIIEHFFFLCWGRKKRTKQILNIPIVPTSQERGKKNPFLQRRKVCYKHPKRRIKQEILLSYDACQLFQNTTPESELTESPCQFGRTKKKTKGTNK